MSATRIEVLYDMQTIHNRIASIAQTLNQDYKDVDNVVLVGVLKGAVNFFAHLSTMIDFNIEYEFVGVASYEGTESTGDIKLTTRLPDLRGKHVIIVEDIVDTGSSMQYLKELIEPDAIEVKVCTLLDKPSRRIVDIDADYVAFEIPNYFVVGFGLDYNQEYRNLPYIGVLEQWG